jgi:hypothetical protein
VAGVVGELAVQGDAGVQGDIGDMAGDGLEVVAVEAPGLFAANPHSGRDAVGAQLAQPGAVDQRVGVDHGHDHALDLSGDDQVDAGGGLAEMAAGLEGEVEGGAGDGQVFQRRGFSVLHAECPVVAAGNDFSVFHGHGADHGIGFGKTRTLPAQLEGHLHEFQVICPLPEVELRIYFH